MDTIPAHILLVDDDPGITEQLSRILEKAGFVVTVATDGEEGLELIRSLRPDLVLLDIDLPKLDGRLVLLRVRGDEDQTPIIMLTKYSDIASEVVGFELGADDYIGKPFSGEVVVARIRAVLRRTRAGQTFAGQISQVVQRRVNPQPQGQARLPSNARSETNAQRFCFAGMPDASSRRGFDSQPDAGRSGLG